MKKSSILAIIIVYLIIGIIIPFVLNCTVFNKSACSSISIDGWASFLGSYIGGVLGGLGTLIAMYMTIKQAMDMQADNKKDSDQRMFDEIQRRNDEYKRDKADRIKEQEVEMANRQREMREEFANSIADLIGRYVTHISKYHFATLGAESLNRKLQNAQDDLNKKRRDYMSYQEKSNSIINSDSAQAQIQTQTEKEKLHEAYYLAKERYDAVKAEYDENSKFGKRLEANEAFFIIHSKLSGIKEAEKMIKLMEEIHHDSTFHHKEESYGDWITDSCDSLIEEYRSFRERYVK